MGVKSKVVREPIGVWWKIASYCVNIEPVQVVSVTESFISYIEIDTYSKSRRERRESNRDFYSSFAAAKDEAIRRTEQAIKVMNDNIQRKRSELGQWKSLKEPEVK